MRRIEREFTPPSRWIWFLSLLIILIGVLVLLYALGRPDRQRRVAMDGVELGAPAEVARRVIGQEPVRCPPGPLGHLAGSFPGGWPPAAVDVALEQLEAATEERWVFAIGSATEPSCGGEASQTEIGVDSVGTIVWKIAQVGHTNLALPPWVTPAGAAPVAPPADP